MPKTKREMTSVVLRSYNRQIAKQNEAADLISWRKPNCTSMLFSSSHYPATCSCTGVHCPPPQLNEGMIQCTEAHSHGIHI